MRVRRGASSEAKVEQQMTAMIDVVFQLLTFFVMSFKVATMEGDFNIKMPLGAVTAGSITDNSLPPMKLRMQADPNGQLVGMRLNDKSFPSNGWAALRTQILGVVGDQTGPDSTRETAEVELDCDYNLKYEYVIQAITAVSGYPDGAGNIVRLVEKVKFAPPRGGGAGG
jgi:biopolymer transport protein ExbD